jgi:glycolate oxidase
VEEQAGQIGEVCRACGARDVRVAQSEPERALLWKGRKNAFGAIGRVSPTYYVQDGVVPRTKVAQTLRAIDEIAKKYGIPISNVFHAGDGNMHPILPFDPRKPGDLDRARKAGEEILEYCISVGGSITGEHGVGMEKMDVMGLLFSDDTLELMKRFKALFDPQCRLNPGKVLPTGKGCLEIRQKPEMVV